jgi:hypothetical protein
MRIMCGVLGHMGREAFGCNPKYNHWDLQNFLSYGYAKRADQFNIPNIILAESAKKTHPTTVTQNLDLQDALMAADGAKILDDRITGTARKRAGLARL